MGFWDTFEDESGYNWVGKAEKAALIDTGTPIAIKRVFKRTSKFGPGYVVVVDLNDEERALSFGAESVESRDRLLDAMTEYLATSDEGTVVEAKIVKKGQSDLIQPLDAE
jgi:hypothetical protein